MTIHIPWWLVSFLLGVLSLAFLFGSFAFLEPFLVIGQAGVFALLITVSWVLAVGMGVAAGRKEG